MENSASFTGHRDLPADATQLRQWTKETVIHLITTKGVNTFLAGGAIGYDTLAAEIILELRKLHPIKLIQVLPFKGQDDKWTPEQQYHFHFINGEADKVICLADRFTGNELYHIRNRYLVDNADYLIAYCKNTGARSGTASTYRYAVKQGKEIFLYK